MGPKHRFKKNEVEVELRRQVAKIFENSNTMR